MIAHALAWHLANNFWPPVTARMIPACNRAIDACRNGEVSRRIWIARGVTLEAGRIVEDLRLEEFVGGGE